MLTRITITNVQQNIAVLTKWLSHEEISCNIDVHTLITPKSQTHDLLKYESHRETLADEHVKQS